MVSWLKHLLSNKSSAKVEASTPPPLSGQKEFLCNTRGAGQLAQNLVAGSTPPLPQQTFALERHFKILWVQCRYCEVVLSRKSLSNHHQHKSLCYFNSTA